jgi:beta-mannanase
VNAISSPNQDWNDLDKYYPGDDYIDWIGVSVYGAQSINDSWVDFDNIYSHAYKKITSFTEKSIAIVELGVAEGSSESLKASWITSALQSLEQGKYPATKAISYWHSSWYDAGVQYSLKIDSSTSAERAFRDGIDSSYFISDTLIK